MALSFKLSNLLGGKKNTGSPVTVVMDDRHYTPKKSRETPKNTSKTHSSSAQRMQNLGVFSAVLLVIIGALVFRDIQQLSVGTAYMGAVGEMRMLSQRLAKASSLALYGRPDAFPQLAAAEKSFVHLLSQITYGGELEGTSLSSSPDSVQTELNALTRIWDNIEKNTKDVLAQQTTLINLGKNVALIETGGARMFDQAEKYAALKTKSPSSATEIAAANHLTVLTQRIQKNAVKLLVGEEVNPEVAFALGKDTVTFRDTLGWFSKGNESMGISATSDAVSAEKLKDLESSFNTYQAAVSPILEKMQLLVVAKRASTNIFVESEELLKTSDALLAAYQSQIADRTLYIIALIVLAFLTATSLLSLALLYLHDIRSRTVEAERLREISEKTNRENQDAILRLMNELGDLADGDLTVVATVSEDITGAISDSINYTVEELRLLVEHINDAANQLTSATNTASKTSENLLKAAKHQALEIQEAGSSVLNMADSMNEVSDSASRSAHVANQSLDAAEKGTSAVRDSIEGMNEIRNQIQETSKRIKRLGESSQEIGEIVELISDITEQTNVLALNAAIQAASAGDAGRGFTVVAEEVQRLAERSAEATKQIAAIVKTIQADTQDAVSAMEQSTQGVVEGARLSDAAGQALSEISLISKQLADLIENIAQSTRDQSGSATKVAHLMQDILKVTEQTTVGTQHTAQSIAELTGLASELKDSVSGFRVE